ncbi:MAG TPA: PAS domain S-box protein [Arenimonas sp.]|nr:PAS domain S-box protein [Arenimonas sp.]
MSSFAIDPGDRPGLRQIAQQQLAAGIAPTSRGWGVSVEALAMLHRLASAPASAGDALKLLHELQVHQVELDLQHAQLEANERETAEELARYRTLFERAPVACLVLDAELRIEQCNRAGAVLLGGSDGEVCGRKFDELLSRESRPSFFGLLDALRAGVENPSGTVRPLGGAGASRLWRVAVSAPAGSDGVLLVVIEDAGPIAG